MLRSLDDWHELAVNTVNPYILEKNEKQLSYYHGKCLNKTEEVLPKPDNWKQVMAVVNGNWTPISIWLVGLITELFPDVTIDHWNPWPVLAELNISHRMEMTLASDGSNLVLKRTSDGKTAREIDQNAPAVYAKWCQLGLDILCFATLVNPAHVNMHDPWLGLMRLKAEQAVKLIYCYPSIIVRTLTKTTEIVTEISAVTEALIPMFNNAEKPPAWMDVAELCSLMKVEHSWTALMDWKKANSVYLEFKAPTIIVEYDGTKTPAKRFPKGLNAKALCAFFNLGDFIPPGCITAWDPCYSVQEALPILKTAYGTAEFHKLRVMNNKLLRSPL